MEEMSAYSGIGKLNDEASDPKETTPYVATFLNKIRRYLSPIRRTMRKLSGDGLLGFTVYAVLFVGIFNSSTNSMQFGSLILVAIHADKFSSNDTSYELDRNLVRFIAVAALSIICLVQFFSPMAGRRLNNVAAVVKILFMLLLIIFGGLAASKAQKNRWTQKNCVLNNGTSGVLLDNSCCLKSEIDSVLRNTCFMSDVIDDNTEPGPDSMFVKRDTGSDACAKALLLVLFSFEGREKATFVSSSLDT